LDHFAPGRCLIDVQWQRLGMQLALWTEADPDEASGVHVLHGTAVPRDHSAASRALERLEARAARYVEGAHTRRAYRKDRAAFDAWYAHAGKGALPASGLKTSSDYDDND
jgi:hypothetical protein